MEKVKNVTILGSTGSIGTQALEVIEKMPRCFKVIALSAGNNLELLEKQIKKFRPEKVCIKSYADTEILKKKFPKLEVVFGDEGLIELTSCEKNDMIVVALSGKTGLKPTINAIKHKIDIALANKETLVMAGEYIMKLVSEYGVKLLPVDSEHSAIFQCLQGKNEIHKLIITASGGPFKNKDISQIQKATVEETLKHPNWNMGQKITVDSATLMNKGLEVIEAHHLFNVSYDDIKVVVHSQSIVHSAVEFKDGSVLAQMGLPSMHIPIQYALTYPERSVGIKTNTFDFIANSPLTFEAPDLIKFPCLKLAFEAGKKGGTYPVCLNASNEEAVYAFLKGDIKLWDIYLTVQYMLKNYKGIKNPTIDEILAEDDLIRQRTREYIKKGLK